MKDDIETKVLISDAVIKREEIWTDIKAITRLAGPVFVGNICNFGLVIVDTMFLVRKQFMFIFFHWISKVPIYT
jgi:hypothetical protein